MALFTPTHSLLIKFGRISSLFLSLTFSGPVHTVSLALFRSLQTRSHGLSLISRLLSCRSSLLSLSLRLYVYICAIRNAIWYQNLLLICVGECWEGGEKTRKKITKKSGVILFCLVCEAFFWQLNSANVDVVVSKSEHARSQAREYGAGVLLYVCGAGQGWHRGEIREI